MLASRPDLARLAAQGRARGLTRFSIPLSRRLSADLLTPVSAFLALREGAEMPFLLESVEGGEKLARYSFLGRDPHRVVRAFGARTEAREGSAPFADLPGETIFDALRRYADERPAVDVPGLPRLSGGAVGFLGYDWVRLVERLPDPPPDTLGLPDAVWGFYRSVVAFDHVRHQVVLIAQAWLDDEADDEAAFADAEAEIARLEAALRRTPAAAPEPVRLGGDVVPVMTRAAYEAAVVTAKAHIREGDVFQVVPSQRFSVPFTGDRFNLYRALRQVNPSPYLFYLDYGDFGLVGSSPEVLVRVENGRAEVLPIAGTRPRGADPEADAALADDLQSDAKERAEHLMLVDLGRNDLGRVCATGTVTVERYAFVERYSHVMHLVSVVAGRVAEGRSALDVLAACFPAGTLTGAPKVRAMQLIDTLEPVRRGVYGGAVGYLDPAGHLDTCIAIRTMVVVGGTIHFQAGAGVVADSDPAAEFEETVNKVRALREAVALASRDLL